MACVHSLGKGGTIVQSLIMMEMLAIYWETLGNATHIIIECHMRHLEAAEQILCDLLLGVGI